MDPSTKQLLITAGAAIGAGILFDRVLPKDQRLVGAAGIGVVAFAAWTLTKPSTTGLGLPGIGGISSSIPSGSTPSYAPYTPRPIT